MVNRNEETLLYSSKKNLIDLFYNAWKSMLYKNAFYLSLNNLSTSILGFVFWNLMARFFPPEQVGIGTSLVAASNLVGLLTNLGIGIGLIRFLPDAKTNSGRLINSIFTLSCLLTLMGAFIYLAGVKYFSPALAFLHESHFYPILFILFTISGCLSILTDNSLISGRASIYVFLKNLLISIIKIPLALFAFKKLIGFGIYSGVGASSLIITILSWFVFLPKVYINFSPRPLLDNKILKEMLPYSLANYLANLLNQATYYIYPLIILNVLGPEECAFFWIAWMMTMVLSIIPSSMSQSLFAEGSYDSRKLANNGRKTLLLSLMLSVPAVGSMFILCNLILGVFGAEYAQHGTEVVRFLSLAIIPQSVNIFFLTVNQVRKRVRLIIAQTGIQAFMAIGLGYWLMGLIGLKGIAIGYAMANYAIASIVIWPLLESLKESHEETSSLDDLYKKI